MTSGKSIYLSLYSRTFIHINKELSNPLGSWYKSTFSHSHIHKQKNKLNLILQTVMIIANQMAQDQDLGVQGTRK